MEFFLKTVQNIYLLINKKMLALELTLNLIHVANYRRTWNCGGKKIGSDLMNTH